MWEHAKRRIRELRLPALRTKADCLRLCAGGPWLLIYPDGVWYDRVTPEKLDVILDRHIGHGEPVTEWIAAGHPLPGGRG